MYVLASIAAHRVASLSQRVLVLDDDAVSCNMVLAILREAGYRADTRTTPEQASEALATGQYGVLIADQHRGPIDAIGVARKVQEVHPDVSVILLTGDRTLSLAVEALHAGVFDFMTRSFDLSTLGEHLLDAVHRALGDERSGPASTLRRPAIA